MKKIILAAVVCCMAVSAALFTSCQKGDYNKKTYFIGVLDAEDYNTNATQDKTTFEQYLTSKGFKNTGEGPAFGYFIHAARSGTRFRHFRATTLAAIR